MYRYGFELEGFYVGDDNSVGIPPDGLPVDGFPGLVELRTTGGKSLVDAYAGLIGVFANAGKDVVKVNFALHDNKFDGKQMAELRRTRHFSKDIVDIQNVYGKEPRRLGSVTIASFQVNISNLIAASYKCKRGKEEFTIADQYAIVDTNTIVKALDKEFADEIKASNRQPGMYAIKDNGVRLEYRSLPNSVFEFDARRAVKLLERIKSCVEGN